MKIALCCIGRMENRYAVEYVEHYKIIGFDKIFIYDNNHDGEEHFEDVLQQYIDDGFVDIVDCRNRERWQLSAYNDCYLKHNAEYDWIAFFDFDEFLILVKDKDVKEYLSRFDGYDIVKVNWMIYTDNNLVTDDGRGVLERFTTPMEYDKCVGYSFPENNHVKSFVRGGIDNIKWNITPHVLANISKICNSVGEKSDSTPFQKYNYELAFIKHFTTKTIQEWIDNKLKRGVADRTYGMFCDKSNIDTFFKYNNKTEEKIKYINYIKNKPINVLIVNYNTQNLTDACIKSINKTTPNTLIYVFDNSDKEPFINTFKNVRIIDNTKGGIINFDEILSKYSNKTSFGARSGYGTLKHASSVDKCFDIINDNFILLDSDVLVKKDISELYDEDYLYVGHVEKCGGLTKPRLLPYICFLNVKELKKKGIRYFDENRIVGVSKNGDKFDTGASIVIDTNGLKTKEISINSYIEHYGDGSWNNKYKRNKITAEEWLNKFCNLWDDNLDLFIGTYKDFHLEVNCKSYKIIVGNHEIKDNYNLDVIKCGNENDKLDDKFYSEIYMLSWLSENYSLHEYVGYCHYRRYFSFMDNIPNMGEVFKTNDIIIGKPINFSYSIREHYGRCHNVEDLNIVEGIIKEKYPSYYNIFERYMNQKMFIPYNMFIMRKEDFLMYVEFIKGVLGEYIKIVGTDIYKRIEDNKDKYLKKFSPNDTVEYQYRIGGYLAERLTGVFICKHFTKARYYEIKITEKKY